jgi:SPFH domain / Band 7 family
MAAAGGPGGQAAISLLTNLSRAAIGLGVGASLLGSSLYTVDGGQRAVIFDRFRGVLPETVGEGTHFLVPWLQKPYIFDIRTRPHTFTSNSGTRDLQMVIFFLYEDQFILTHLLCVFNLVVGLVFYMGQSYSFGKLRLSIEWIVF